MPIKGLGIYPAADKGWHSHLKDIFSRSGVDAFSTVAVTLKADTKDKTVAKGEETVTKKVKRLRYQGHNNAISKQTPCAQLINPGDEVRVVWIGHGGYVKHEDGGISSLKFAPHHETAGDQAYMSATELARCIAAVCRPAGGGQPVYPTVLMIVSCYSGHPRMSQWKSMTMSKSDQPLAFRVLHKLRPLCNPPQMAQCTVYAPLRDLMGTEIRMLSVPPSTKNGDWASQSA